MTNKDKLLLLTDLCARLTYGIKCHYKYFDYIGGAERLVDEGDANITGIDAYIGNPVKVRGKCIELENVKPYLRPMSGMTEKEKSEYNIIKCSICPENADDYSGFVDWLNEHHFDHRGLIPKGLALEAPEEMYN